MNTTLTTSTLNASLPNSGPIPARIIQTGKSYDLPIRNRASIASLKSLNPDFEYLFYDDAGVNLFIDQEFPQYQSVFDGFPFPIQRFDFFRYLAIYRFGGFYFDLDVFLAESLVGLLTSGCVFPFEGLTWNRYLQSRYGIDWEIGNYAFGAAAGHPFLKAVIENCVKAQLDSDWVRPMLAGIPLLFRSKFYVLCSSGPGLITRTLVERPEFAENVTVLFPNDVCDSRNWNRFGELGFHLMENSWDLRGGWMGRRLERVWNAWQTRRWMPESVKTGRRRSMSHRHSGLSEAI